MESPCFGRTQSTNFLTPGSFHRPMCKRPVFGVSVISYSFVNLIASLNSFLFNRLKFRSVMEITVSQFDAPFSMADSNTCLVFIGGEAFAFSRLSSMHSSFFLGSLSCSVLVKRTVSVYRRYCALRCPTFMACAHLQRGACVDDIGLCYSHHALPDYPIKSNRPESALSLVKGE